MRKTTLPANFPAATAAMLTGLIMAGGATASAQTATNNVQRLPAMVIAAESEDVETVQGPFLPPVQGTHINAGKKTTVLDLDDLPKVIGNNYRQALTKTPGLLLSEETTPLVSIGYRGLNPNRAQFTQVLKDGIPIHADQFGYPEAYYTPPLDTVDRLEFLRGGASLMYGPQPGGALNYVTHRPRTDRPISGRTQQTFGSDNLFSSYTSVDGTVDRLGYYAYFNLRQSDGFRSSNSDYALYNGSARLVLDATKDSRWLLSYDGYTEEHGEPGGLSHGNRAFDVNYRTSRNQASRLHDRFELKRHVATLTWERDFSDNTSLHINTWGGYYSRFSKRQRTANLADTDTPDTFGVAPNGAEVGTNTIEHQEFYTQGVDARLRHDWHIGGYEHTFAGGVQLYHADSPRTDRRGATPNADTGAVRNQSDRESWYAPVFLENRFVIDRLSITPGVRFENIRQSVKENVNVGKTDKSTPLGSKRQFDFVPLFGIGFEYKVATNVAAYANASQSYRPKIFTEAVPTGGLTVVNQNLSEGKAWQYEIGVRGQPKPYLQWDTSLFWMDFSDQIGTVGNSVQNIGRAVHRGWEGSAEIELLGLTDALSGGTGAPQAHQFSLHGNCMLLDAQLKAGANAGKTPQYAPDYTVRAGAIYRFRDRAKVGLLGTFLGSHWANDNNGRFVAADPGSSSFIPAYAVWDLTVECKVYKQTLSVVGGINNLLDRDYYARVTASGIDPAYRRNYYAGLSVAF